jgi:hypothetical protein
LKLPVVHVLRKICVECVRRFCFGFQGDFYAVNADADGVGVLDFNLAG